MNFILFINLTVYTRLSSKTSKTHYFCLGVLETLHMISGWYDSI